MQLVPLLSENYMLLQEMRSEFLGLVEEPFLISYFLGSHGVMKISFIMFILQCFLKMKPEYLTFNAANEKCVTFGGSLPSISNQAEQGMMVNWGHF